MRTLCYVVGDGFAAFANGVRVLTSSQLRQRLCDGALDWGEIDLDRGLGLGADEYELVRNALVEACAPTAIVDRFRQERAALRLTHKRESGHVLVGPAVRLGARTFEFQMVVDGSRDRLSDHVTGQHVGGMLLIEAARQAATVALEQLHEEISSEVGASWTDLRASFRSFVFPLPVRLVARCDGDPEGTHANQIAAPVTVTAHQMDHQVAELAFDFTLFRRSLLARLEQRAATRAIARAVGNGEASAPAVAERRETA
jgi:hypothetical protein